MVTAWAIVFCPGDTSVYHTMSIYLRFKARVVLTNVSEEMNEHLLAEFDLLNKTHVNPWGASSIVRVERVVSESGRLVVRVDTDGSTV